MGGLTLFEIDEAIREVIELHTDEYGVLSDEGDRALDELIGKREAKLLAYGCVIKELKAEAEAVKAEAKAMRKRAQTIGNREQDLRERCGDGLGIDNKLRDHRVSLYWQKSERVVVDDESRVPWELRKIVDSPDLTLLREKLLSEDAAELDGIAHLEIRRTLVVR